MASRRPILASNVPSLGEVLNEKNAMMFVPDNANDLAEKMQVLRSDPVRAERLSMESYRTVQEFTWAKRALKIETFLHTV
jgi:glycosyltransferase involved in cell wall biosynthesis